MTPSPASQERALSVLIVDDNADLRFVIRLGLDRDDRFCGVREAANGRDAIDVASAEPPDVILLDQMMPVMTGLEALPRLREVAPDARIVLFSAIAEQLGADGEPQPDAFVAKGCDLCELYDTLAVTPVGAATQLAS